MSSTQKPRMGRPPGQKFPHLLHIRLSDEIRDELKKITDERMDQPDMAAVVRELLAEAIVARRNA